MAGHGGPRVDEATMSDLWDASVDESSAAALTHLPQLLTEPSWSSIDFMELIGQNATESTHEMRGLQDSIYPGGNPAHTSLQNPVQWQDNNRNMSLPPHRGSGIQPLMPHIPRATGSTPVPPLFTSNAPPANATAGIPSKLLDFIAPHLPSNTDLSSLINTSPYPDHINRVGQSSRIAHDMCLPSEYTGQGTLPTSGLYSHSPESVCMQSSTMESSLPLNSQPCNTQIHPGMNMMVGEAGRTGMPPGILGQGDTHSQTHHHILESKVHMPPSPVNLHDGFQTHMCGREHSTNVDMQGTDSMFPEMSGGFSQTQDLFSSMQHGNYRRQRQSEVWGSDSSSNLECRSWNHSPTGTGGFPQTLQPSEVDTISWSPNDYGIQLDPSLVPTSPQTPSQVIGGPLAGPMSSTANGFEKRVSQNHSPSPEPQVQSYQQNPGQVSPLGGSVADDLEVLDIESSISSVSSGASGSSGHRVQRSRKSQDDLEDSIIMCPKKVVRKNVEGEGCPARQEAREISKCNDKNYGGTDELDVPAEEYLRILREAGGCEKTLAELMPNRAPGPLDSTLEEIIQTCDFDLRVSRAQKKMEEHNASMERIDKMVKLGQLSREEGKSRRRQAYNRREAAASRARKDTELRDLIKEKERLEKMELHLRKIILSGHPSPDKKKPSLRRQKSAGACGFEESTPVSTSMGQTLKLLRMDVVKPVG